MWPVQNNPLCMSYEKNMCLSIKLYIYRYKYVCFLACVVFSMFFVLFIPESARHAPGRKFQKLDIAIGTSLLVGIVGELARGELK